MTTPTIAALATAPFPAGLAVIRVSGPKSAALLKLVFKTAGKFTKGPHEDTRRMVFGTIVDPATNAVLDQALAVLMPGPNSYTGEDVAELQFHGSPLLVERVLRMLYAQGAEPARAGEFTERAFLNGKLDLAQAEAVAELTSASSEAALRVAAEQLKGRLSDVVAAIGEPLRDTLAELEALLDFPDEDLPASVGISVSAALVEACEKIETLAKTYRYGHIIRDGFRVLLCGKPNVGKSSLMNVLLGKKRAIVTPVSGTTRDIIEEEFTLGGYRFVLCDSAGLRDTSDTVEKIGIELARERMPWADVVLFVVDATDPDTSWQQTLVEVKAQAKQIWLVINKIDENPKAVGELQYDLSVCSQSFYVSARTKAGIDDLKESLVGEVKQSLPDRGEASTVMTNERHLNCLNRSLADLRQADALINSTTTPAEVTASVIRSALKALDEIIGKTYTEDILGRIFSKFCIGK